MMFLFFLGKLGFWVFCLLVRGFFYWVPFSLFPFLLLFPFLVLFWGRFDFFEVVMFLGAFVCGCLFFVSILWVIFTSIFPIFLCGECTILRSYVLIW
jgi:hypothetical protein